MLFLCRHLAINRPQGYDTFRQRIRRFVAWQILDQPGDWRCAVGQNPAVVGRDGWEMLKYGNFWSIWNCDMNLVTVGFCGSIGKKLHVFAGVLKMPAYQGFGDSNGVWGFQWFDVLRLGPEDEETEPQVSSKILSFKMASWEWRVHRKI